MGAVTSGHDLSEDEMRQEQDAEFGNLKHYAGENGMIVDQGDILSIEKRGDLAVIVLKVIVETVLAHVHETSVSGKYCKRTTLVKIQKRFCWKTWKRNV